MAWAQSLVNRGVEMNQGNAESQLYDRSEANRLLRRAVEIPSLSGSETQLALMLKDWAAKKGLRAWIDDVGNVHARNAAPGLPVLLLSHLDTVGGVVEIDSSDLYVAGRGSVDAKGSLVSMLVAVSALSASDTPLYWIGAVEEETMLSRGAEHVRSTVDMPAALIVGEPSGSNSVTVGYKGRTDFRFEFVVPDSHTATPLPKASELAISFLGRVLDRYSSSGNDSFHNVGLAISETRLDVSHSSGILAFRIPPTTSIESLQAELVSLIDNSGTVTRIYHVPAVSVRRTDPVVRGLSSAIAMRGEYPRHVLKTGTCDMNTLAQSWQIPMATYGPGDSELDHSATEHLPYAEFHNAIESLIHALPLIADDIGE